VPAECRFWSRPQKTITKTQYIEKAKAIGERAKELAGAATDLKRQQDSQGRSRKLRTQQKALGKELMALEDEERELEKLYPQVRTHATHACAERQVHAAAVAALQVW
jgi:LMBR1 domain-containing protein 1